MIEVDTQHLFIRLAPDIQARLRDILHVCVFKTKERVFAQGAPTSALYLVVSGQVKVTRVTPEGHEIILCVRGPGDYFCPVSVLDGGTQLGTAVALTEVTLLWAERAEFRALCQTIPELLLIAQGDCLGEVRRLIDRMELLAFHSVKERLAVAMLTASLHQQTNGVPTDELRLTQQELAELVGAARESVSRTLAQMAREGMVILKRGCIILHDRQKLKHLAGE